MKLDLSDDPAFAEAVKAGVREAMTSPVFLQALLSEAMTQLVWLTRQQVCAMCGGRSERTVERWAKKRRIEVSTSFGDREPLYSLRGVQAALKTGAVREKQARVVKAKAPVTNRPPRLQSSSVAHRRAAQPLIFLFMPQKPPRKFAEGTTVPAGKTRLEIEELLKRHGAEAFIYGEEAGTGSLRFKMRGRHIMFRLKLVDERQFAAEHRRRWRALLLVLKGKLESVTDQTIETFEEAFLAHTVTPEGATVGEIMLPQLKDAYATGRQPVMLLALPSSPTGGHR